MRYRRAVAIYLVAIVGPTLVLLYLGLQSVARQRQAISVLTASNVRLAGEKLAADVEHRVRRLAEACLRDPELRPRQLSFARVRELRERHPIAQHVFLLEAGVVRYPVTRAPSTLPSQPDVARQRLWAQAEDLEVRQRRPDAALAAYERIYRLSPPGSKQALALARIARCLQKLRRVKDAEQAYRTLLERYDGLPDPFDRPYGVIARFELGQWQQSVFSELRRDLLGGRWELSGEQLDYFLTRLPPALTDGERNIPFVAQFRLARALEAGLRHSGSVGANELYVQAVGEFLVFYISAGTDALVGLAADLDWVQDPLVRQARAELRLETSVGLSWTNGRWEPFATPAAAESGQASARRELIVFAGTVVLILAVLVLGVLLLIRDVRRDLDLSRLRSDFVSAVSHELKTPLTLIRLHAETLLERQSLPESERRNFFRIILRESDRLTHLLSSVLELSRIERGSKQYRIEEGSLAPVVANTVETYADHLRRRGFDVEIRLAETLPPVRFDASAVSQAIVNLLDNAAKYSGDSSFVGVRLWPEDGHVIIEVEDRGIGVPLDEREKIFERFYRAPNDSGKGGYGLGLYLVRHIMAAHGGQVDLASEPGRGSRFRLMFPQASYAHDPHR